MSGKNTDPTETKSSLWRILRKNGPPRINNIKTLKDGRLLIRPGSDDTENILENRKEDGLTATKPKNLNPRILIYDVDRDIADAELVNLMVDQNPEL